MRDDRQGIARSKQELRRRQADLPFEEKIRIVVWMQKVSREFALMNGREPGFVWEIEYDVGPIPT